MHDLAPPLAPKVSLLVGRCLGLALSSLVSVSSVSCSTALSQPALLAFLQSVCADCRSVHARRQPVGPIQAQPRRGVLPHGHHLLRRHMDRPALHPLFHHPHRPRPRHPAPLKVARRRLHRRLPLLDLAALLDLREHPRRLEEQAQPAVPSPQGGRHLPARQYVYIFVLSTSVPVAYPTSNSGHPLRSRTHFVARTAHPRHQGQASSLATLLHLFHLEYAALSFLSRWKRVRLLTSRF